MRKSPTQIHSPDWTHTSKEATQNSHHTNKDRLTTTWNTNNLVCTPAQPVRGALLAKGPDSSLGEVHKGSCSEDIHMEEEKAEVIVQEDELEDGRDK